MVDVTFQMLVFDFRKGFYLLMSLATPIKDNVHPKDIFHATTSINVCTITEHSVNCCTLLNNILKCSDKVFSGLCTIAVVHEGVNSMVELCLFRKTINDWGVCI